MALTPAEIDAIELPPIRPRRILTPQEIDSIELPTAKQPGQPLSPEEIDRIELPINPTLRREPPASLENVPSSEQVIRINPAMDKEVYGRSDLSLQPDRSNALQRALASLGERLQITPRTLENPSGETAKAFPRLSAADIAAGNVKALLPGVDPETGESEHARFAPSAPAPNWAKVAAGAQHAVAGTAEALVPFIIGGQVTTATRLPLLARGVSAYFAQDMLRALPDTVQAFVKAVESGDVQTATEAGVGSVLGGYFSYKAAQHAVGRTAVPQFDRDGNPLVDPKTGKQQVKLQGIAEESPAIRWLLTRKIATDYAPEQIREIYNRVNLGTANPAEQELVRFINQSFESPKQAIQSGVRLKTEQPVMESQFWRDYLGLKEPQTTADLLKRKPLTPEEIDQIKPTGGPDASPIVEPSSVRKELEGVAPEREAVETPGAGNRLPRPAGQPAGARTDVAEAEVAHTVAREINATFKPVGVVSLEGVPEAMRPELERINQQNGWEFTAQPGSPIEGQTFYVPVGASREQIMQRYGEKVAQSLSPKAKEPGTPSATKVEQTPEPSAAPEWQRPRPLAPGDRRALEKRAEDKIAIGDQIKRAPAERRLARIIKDHQAVRKERDEATTTGDKLRAEIELTELENELRKLAGEPEIELARPITEEDQAKSKAWFANRAKEIEAKISRGEPINAQDRQDWRIAGRSASDLPPVEKPIEQRKEAIPSGKEEVQGQKVPNEGQDVLKPTGEATPPPSPKPSGSSLRKPQPETKPAKVETKWTKIGTNSDGKDVFEDDRGVRSVVRNGVRVTEAVGLVPTRGPGGSVVMAIGVPSESERKGTDYEVVPTSGELGDPLLSLSQMDTINARLKVAEGNGLKMAGIRQWLEDVQSGDAKRQKDQPDYKSTLDAINLAISNEQRRAKAQSEFESKQPTGASLRKPKAESPTVAGLRAELKKLRQGLPVAEDMAMNDKGASLDRLNKQIAAKQAELDKALGIPEPKAQPETAPKEKTEIKSPVANLSADEQAELEALEKDLLKKLGGTYTGIDPEIAVLAAKMANLYAKGGVRTFAQFARNVKDRVPTIWERIKAYLRAAWNQIADMLGFDEVSRADAEAVFADLDKQPTKKESVTDERPVEQRGGSAKKPDVETSGLQGGAAGVSDGGRVGGDQPATGAGVGSGQQPVGTGGRSTATGGSGSAPGERSGDVPSVAARDERDVRRAQSPPVTSGGNYVITPTDRLGEGTPKQKASDNLEAIKLVKLIEQEKRPATTLEQAKLVRYVGWGGLKGVFDDGNPQFARERAELKKLLTEEEYAAARASIQDAHYTSATVIQRGIYAAMRRFGFTGGRMVEGGVGTGNFIGLMPEDLRAATVYLGVERDHITARIAQLLYPQAKILQQGFQEATLARESFDGAVSNPPFGKKAIFDPQFPDASKFSIHNFFIGKTLELLRPGGVAGFVVSRYFLDNSEPMAREYIAQFGEFLGAIRLPNTAFKENANTQVVTDLVFFRRVPKGTETNTAWTEVRDYTDPASKQTWKVNRWMVEHPAMVLGEITKAARGLYSKEELTVNPTGDLATQLDQAVAALPANVYKPAEREMTERLTSAEVPTEVRVGSYFMHKGRLKRRLPDLNAETQAEPVEMKEGTTDRIKAIVPIRDALNSLVKAEMSDDATDKVIEALRTKLNKAYDSFVKNYGFLNSPTNRRAFYDDTDSTRVLGLESEYNPGLSAATAKKKGVEAIIPSAKKADIFSKRVNAPYQEVTSVETAKEALTVSLNQRGAVDLDYMAGLMNTTPDKLASELGDLVFRVPRAGWESKEVYLSGNVRQKLKEAQDAALDDPTMERNVEALKAVIPKDIAASDIVAPVGAPWVDAKDVSAFARELIGSDPDVVLYRKSDGGWSFEHRDRGTNATQRWGTGRMPFGELFKLMLNGRLVVVKDMVDQPDGGEKPVINDAETAAAESKSGEIRDKWAEWIWRDQERRDRLHRVYNDTYNNFADVVSDGSHLTLPGASTAIVLRAHQKNIAWRTITSAGGGLLYDHVVGAGKTFAGVAGMMELRRIGRVRKWLVTVPNHLTGQWADAFSQLYPNSNVLAAKPADFSKENRQRLFAKILTGDFDAVVLGHTGLKKIGTSPEIEKGILNEMLKEIIETIEAVKKAEGDSGRKRGSRQLAQMERTRDNLKAKLDKLSNIKDRDVVATFEELGFDGMFVDEAHEFKNLFYTTQMQNVAGLGDAAGSAKAFDLYLKTRYLRERYGGKAPLVFATGTPISNSLVEMFTMQRYLQPDVLAAMGAKTLDTWARVFADIRQVYEVDPTGTGYRMATRFANFQNVGDLTAIYKNMADVITMTDLQAQAEAAGTRFPVPKVKGGKPMNHVVERSKEQAEYFGIETQNLDSEGQPMFDSEGNPSVSYPKGTILWRVDNMPDDPREDNMLKLTNDARKAGLDMRLINPDLPDNPKSKINLAVGEIKRLYDQWADKKGTQLVFCDLSIPSSARNSIAQTVFYRDYKTGLINKGRGRPFTIEGSPEWAEWFVVNTPSGFEVIERHTGVVSGGAKTRKGATEMAKSGVNAEVFAALESFYKKRGDLTDEQVSEWLDKRQQEEEANSDELAISMDELLAVESKFSVYDDMREKLIRAGIPANDIAFIHDYDSPEKKQKLFKQVNDGDIRILFGSTPKMGAGTNVQRRVVGVQHMDAPWRPSDLEQRNGRVIRQGNLFYEEGMKQYANPQDYDKDENSFAVEEHRYATSLTYDTRMWQIIEHKALGIEGFRKADRSTRTMEDVAGEATNAADMKAAASGDPAIQREIELRNARRKLELLKAAWNRNQIELKNREAYLQSYEPRHKSEVDALNEKIARRDANTQFEEKPGKEGQPPERKMVFAFTLPDGTTTDEKGVALEQALQLIKDGKRGFIGTYRGFKLSVDQYRFDFTGGKGLAFYTFTHDKDPFAGSSIIAYGPHDQISGVGFFQRLDNWLKNFEEHIAGADNLARYQKTQLDEVRGEIARPFTKGEELTRLSTEHDQVRTELMNKKKKKVAPPTPPPTDSPKPEGEAPDTRASLAPPVATPASQAAVESGVRSVLGELPVNVTFVNDPAAPRGSVTMVAGQPPQITLNLAKLDSAEQAADTLREELIHAVWDAPEVADARKTIERLIDETDRQRKTEAGYNPNETEEEAANERARRIFDDATKANIFVRAWRAIVEALRKLFGFGPSKDGEARAAAKTIMREAVQNRPASTTGQRGAEPLEPTPEQRAAVVEEAVREQWIPTQVMGETDYVRGREQWSASEVAASRGQAEQTFRAAGVLGRWDNETQRFIPAAPWSGSESAGRHLVEAVRQAIAQQGKPGAPDIAALINSIRVGFANNDLDAFDAPTRQELYRITQAEASHRGLALGALAHFAKDVGFVGNNVDVVLTRVWSDAFGGQDVASLMERVINNFRNFFTDEEIANALKSKEGAERLIGQMIALNRRDEGGRVYRRVQSLLKPKNEKKLAALKRDARIEEAVQEILNQAAREGIQPIASPDRPLPALERLLLMVSPKNAATIDRMIANAVSQAERNAGIAVALKNAQDDEEREQLQADFAGGADPSPEDIEEGLELPQFSHWKAIRDNLTDYSPTTLKLVQEVVREEFKGTTKGRPRAKVADSRIDLNQLAIQPEAEVQRVIEAHRANILQNVELAGATGETMARVEQMIEREVATQLERARTRVRNPLFVERKPGQPVSAEQKLAQQINAGLFRDERLDIPELVSRVAGKSQLQRIAPALPDLIKQVFETPFYRQSDLKDEFARRMTAQYGVEPEQADKAAEVFAQAFGQKFAQAKARAIKLAREAITPKEPALVTLKKSVWRRIEQAVNSGLFDNGSILREIAQAHGWAPPTDELIAKMKAWSAEEQRLRELSPSERAAIGDDQPRLDKAQREKEAVTMETRVALKKKIEVEWSKLTRPIAHPFERSFWANKELRRNFAAAANELASANLLLKIGFVPRQIISVLTQGASHTPTRAIAHAIGAHQMEVAKGRESDLWQGIGIALKDSYAARMASLKSALYATRAAFLGRGESRNVDRLMSGIASVERIARQADIAEEKGEHGKATILRITSLIRLGYRVAQALDNIHGLPAEYQEMVNQVERGLREMGKSRAEIQTAKDLVLRDMNAEWSRAVEDAKLIFEQSGLTPTEAQLKESAWNLVKRRQYDRIRELGLPSDDFEEQNRQLRSTIGWNERETKGPGGLVGGMVSGVGRLGEAAGIPLAIGRFGNAIAIGINRAFMFTPFYKLADVGPGESTWFRTETDRTQRKIEAAFWTGIGILVMVVAAMGGIIVRLAWPRDKEERDLWEAQGIRPNTVEFHLGDGKFIPLSLNTGPMQPLAPYLAAGGALHDLRIKRDKAQAKLDADAAKSGLPAGKLRPMNIGDMLAVAAAAAQGSLMGGRTAAGLMASVTDYGVPNSQKMLASQVSPLVPGLPALQEVSRMAGVTLDARMASFWDFMLPLPTSSARKVNLLGDPAGTPDDLQRIIQVLTGGSYPGVVDTQATSEQQAYRALFTSGYRPPSIDPNKGYAFPNGYRPMTDQELQTYTVNRGQYFKAELASVGDTEDPKAARAAYQRANDLALTEMGVSRRTSAPSAAPAATQPAAVATATRAISVPRAPGGGLRRPSIRPASASLRLRRGRAPSSRFGRGPSLRIGRTKIAPAKALKGRSLRLRSPRLRRR